LKIDPQRGWGTSERGGVIQFRHSVRLQRKGEREKGRIGAYSRPKRGNEKSVPADGKRKGHSQKEGKLQKGGPEEKA